MSDIILNPEQTLAVNHRDGPCLVTSCPGSGKTRVIVERTIKLVESGVNPTSILSVTFTNKAAKEMRQRLLLRLGERAKQLTMLTIHAFCARCLRRYGHLLGYSANFAILDEDEQVDELAQVARQCGFDWNKKAVRYMAGQMDDCREKMLDEEDMKKVLDKKDSNWFIVVQTYLERLRAKDRIDFSGLLTETLRLLKERKVALDAIQARFSYFQMDEAQDSNKVQMLIVELMASHTRNLVLVGDTDQSIYRFRGARPENITDFIRDYNPRIIRLGQNYRSTPQIVQIADNLIRQNPDRPADDFRTSNPAGPPVECRCFLTPEDEAHWIARQAREAIACGLPPRRIAVLYRLNRMSRPLEAAMRSERVPHVVVGGFSFYDRTEIKDHLAMLRLLLNPFNGIAFQRIANKPKCDLGDVTVGKIEQFADAQKISVLDACRRAKECVRSTKAQKGAIAMAEAYNFDWKPIPLSQCLQQISDRLKYIEFLQKDDPESFPDRSENVAELIDYAGQYSQPAEQSIPALLDQIALMTSADKSDKAKDAVTLSTIHCSKGLEFAIVMLPGWEAGILPHALAVEEPGGLEEERRLAYVAATRAERNLAISYCRERVVSGSAGQGHLEYAATTPSRFLFEMGLLKYPPGSEEAIAHAYEQQT